MRAGPSTSRPARIRAGTGLRHNTLQGRLHFVDQAEVQRSTGWIFSEWTDTDIVNRFNEFSAAELWLLLDSLA